MEYSGALFLKLQRQSLGVIFILQKASFLLPRCSGAHFPFIKHAGRHGEGPPAFAHVPSPWIVKGVAPPCNCDPSLGGCRFRIPVCQGCGEPPHQPPRPPSQQSSLLCSSLCRVTDSTLLFLFPACFISAAQRTLCHRSEAKKKTPSLRFANQNYL